MNIPTFPTDATYKVASVKKVKNNGLQIEFENEIRRFNPKKN